MSHKPIVHPAANNELLSDSTSKHVTRSEPTFHLLQNEGGKKNQSTNESNRRLKCYIQMIHSVMGLLS
jgi:hypothetical protein